MLRDPGERLEGENILAELPGDLGLLLWRAARDVTLWAGTPAESRRDLFSEGSANARLALLAATEIPSRVAASVDTLSGMLSPGSRAEGEIMSLCCLELAAWARGAGLSQTAVAFAQAGALASPEFAEAALHVGAYARAAGQGARAESWLRRSVSLARRERDRGAYAGALAELGTLYESRNDVVQAERFYRWAFRAGRRFSARRARMRASHGLFRLARQRGDSASAAEFALRAQAAYEPDTAGAPDLLLDLARFWTDTGEPARARAALRRLWPSLGSLPPADQLAALALAAWASAGVATPRIRRGAEWAAWELMGDLTIPDGVRFQAALDLAHAARQDGDLAAFTQARRAVLLLAPHAGFQAVATEMAEIWPDSEHPVERAS
ncbi:MAG TPA: hypothetical protein VFR37_15615 [Longimicrobium sp.]|nr:hypothetical protein [Longimicrobium sp.]